MANGKEHSTELIDSEDRYGVSNLKLEAKACYVKYREITTENEKLCVTDEVCNELLRRKWEDSLSRCKS